MLTQWTSNDIEQILIQLDARNLPFSKYVFSELGGGLKYLGQGGSSIVLEAAERKHPNKKYAIKVLGFNEGRVESESFWKSYDTQKSLAEFQQDVVKMFDAIEVIASIEGENKVIEAKAFSKDDSIAGYTEGKTLFLKFMVMEEITPVVYENHYGHPKIFPPKLASCDEKEILYFAYDVGNALYRAHKANVIHRDVKLENVFYSAKEKHYKLGDFGISRAADNGFASTIAFTQGYGAPEVVYAKDDKYDFTADIYSFGMMLYVLLNGLKFPESSRYLANLERQYLPGYIPPMPKHGSPELCRLVLKMCAYNPDDRYQSMEEVLNDLERILYGTGSKIRREHNDAYFAIGSVMAVAGAILFKLSLHQSFEPNVGWKDYIILAMCVLCGAIQMAGKKPVLLQFAIFVLAIWLLITGFAWWKLVFCVVFLFSESVNLIVAALVEISLIVTCMIVNAYAIDISKLSQFGWVGILAISLSLLLLYRHGVYNTRNNDRKMNGFLIKRDWIWLAGISLFGVFCLASKVQGVVKFFLPCVFTERLVTYVINIENIGKAGVCGVVFCLFCFLREIIYTLLERKKEKESIAKMNEWYL